MSLPTVKQTKSALAYEFAVDEDIAADVIARLRVTGAVAQAYVDGRLTPRPTCPMCDGSRYGGDSGHAYNTQEEYDGIHEHVCRECPIPCSTCNSSGYDPDTIQRIAAVLGEFFFGNPDPASGGTRMAAQLVLDALYGKDT